MPENVNTNLRLSGEEQPSGITTPPYSLETYLASGGGLTERLLEGRADVSGVLGRARDVRAEVDKLAKKIAQVVPSRPRGSDE